MMRTLVAPARRGHGAAPGYDVRALTEEDTDQLGHLYFSAYDPGEACTTLDEALADIAATFEGEYGPLWQPGSLGAWRDGRLAAAVMTTNPPPWEDAPRCPFIVELLTDRAHRRQGLARALVVRVLDAACAAEPPEVGLRVAADNEPATALYRSLGFADWDQAR